MMKMYSIIEKRVRIMHRRMSCEQLATILHVNAIILYTDTSVDIN